MIIAEIFQSRQGEGLWTGVESAFVRTSGCNLRCRFCDTKYASWYPEGKDLSVDEIVARIRTINRRHVVITGGEPMLFSELIPLTDFLGVLGNTITIETSGTLDLPVRCDLMSISPKLSNSTPTTLGPRWTRRHENSRHHPEVVRSLIARYEYQLKFVVDSSDDLSEIEAYLAPIPEIVPRRVLLMPQATDVATLWEKQKWLKPYCRKMGYTFCTRKQIEWYGNRRNA
jgi:7-carboxy-7-deazaguanine synthase